MKMIIQHAGLMLFAASLVLAGCNDAGADFAALRAETEQRARAGEAEAQYDLGVMHYQGDGVPRDFKQARAWFLKAAAQNFAEARHNLGVMYYHGEGGPVDYDQAAAWFLKAAEQGKADSQAILGLMYLKGEGLGKDYIRGHMWLSLAEANGLPGAFKNSGVVEELMSADQIAEAKRLAGACRQRRYQGC